MTKFLNISTDATLGGNAPSDELAVSQKAIKTYVDSHGGGVSVDGTTITRNGDNEIQAVATINANTATGSTNPIYDWVGTLSEYETQAIATTHPDWVCYIIDDLQPAPDPIRREVSERNIGEIVYTTVPVSDSGLHLANGDLLDGDGIYADFYTYMVGVYNNGHTSIFCSEADWQASNTTYGKCGKYVLDTANKTIRLPKIPGFVEGTLTESEIGDLVGAGLPNITDDLHVHWRDYSGGWTVEQESARVFYNNGTTSRTSYPNTGPNDAGSYYNDMKLSFDLSRGNPIYGNSSTVQPESIKVYVYIVVANTIKTPIQVDIDDIVTDLSYKASLTQLDAATEHIVVETQEPTSSNGYLWYRKYKDGWIEQGGITSAGHDSQYSFTLPVAMADTNYTLTIGVESTNSSGAGYSYIGIRSKTTTTVYLWCNTSYISRKNWMVCGKAAS